MNDAAMNIHVQVFLWTYIFISLRYKPRNGTAGHMVILHLTFKKCQAIFKTAAPFYIPTVTYDSSNVPISPHPCQHLLLSSHSEYSHPCGHAVKPFP